MHHFRPELRPLRTALAAALLTLLVAAQHAGAQAPASAPATRVTASVDAGVSRVAGEWVPQVGGALTFRLSRFIAVGGAGRVDVTHPELAGQGSTLRMRFGYGGLQVVLHPAPEGWPGLRLGALLAAGNVDVQDRAVGAVLDSDNGAVLEPSMSLSLPLISRVAGSASLSWRLAYGFATLGGLASRDLRGPAFLLGLMLGPF